MKAKKNKIRGGIREKKKGEMERMKVCVEDCRRAITSGVENVRSGRMIE